MPHEAEIVVRHRHSSKDWIFDALTKPSAHYSFSRQKRSGANIALEDLLRGLQEFDPTSETVIVEKTKPSSAKVEKLLCCDEYVDCKE